MLEHFSVTFFTVSKVNGICGQTDQKICISRRWSYANILISSIAFAGGIIWQSFDSTTYTFNSDNEYELYNNNNVGFIFTVIRLFTIIVHWHNIVNCTHDLSIF